MLLCNKGIIIVFWLEESLKNNPVVHCLLTNSLLTGGCTNDAKLNSILHSNASTSLFILYLSQILMDKYSSRQLQVGAPSKWVSLPAG